MNQLPQITKDSIVVHRLGGLVVPVSQKVAGVVVDISAKTMKFKTQSGLNVALVADPSNATGLLISLTEAQVQSIGAAGSVTEFALVDETSTPDAVLWAGSLQVVGF